MVNSEMILAIRHMDGAMERWKVQLDEDYFLFIDCNIPLPWGASDDSGYFGTVVITGYEINDEVFLNSN